MSAQTKITPKIKKKARIKGGSEDEVKIMIIIVKCFIKIFRKMRTLVS